MVWMNGRPVADAIGGAHHPDLRPQDHDVGDLEPLQQQRQQPQIRGQDVDRERGVGGRRALQADVVKRDVACREHRDLDAALDHEVEPGHGADLRLDRLAQGVAVDQPGGRDQATSITPRNAATGVPRRFIPWAIVNDISGAASVNCNRVVQVAVEKGGVVPPNPGLPGSANNGPGRATAAGCQRHSNLRGFLDPFKAALKSGVMSGVIRCREERRRRPAS